MLEWGRSLHMIRQLEEDLVSRKEIRDVEHELGISFPASYVEFLLEYNGGYPTNPLVRAEDGKPIDNVISIYSVTSDLFRREVSLYAELVGQGVLPISGNGAGERWFLDSKTGRIWILKHGADPGDVSVIRGVEVLVEQLAEGKPAVRRITTREGDIVAYLGKKGTVEEVRRYFEENSIDSHDAHGFTVLERAGAHGNLPVFRFCFEQGAALRRGATRASAMGNIDILRYLLARGWDINEKDPDGRMAIDTVIDMETRAFLYEHGSAVPSE